MGSPEPVKTPAMTLRTPESRGLFARSPLTEEAMWKRLKEAGFDEESIKRRDKAALIATIAKLETEKYEVEHHLGLLLLERKEWTSKHEELKASAESAESNYRREQAAHAYDLAEAKKREDALKKAHSIEKECVANLEKALHELRAESAEAKVVAESKLAEARSMMEEAEKKFTEAEVKIHAAESLEQEASRYHRTAERKLREVEEREDDLRRRITSFKSDCDAKENEINLEKQSLRDRQKVLQQSQERLLDGQSLLNQREEHILKRSQELDGLQKELEASKMDMENERKSLTERKLELELLATSLSAREEAVISKECEIKKKEEDLSILRAKLETKEFEVVQQAMARSEAELDLKNSAFEAEMDKRRKLVEEEIEAKRRAWELKEIDMKQKEDLLVEKEHEFEIQSRAISEKEKDLEERFQLIEEKQKKLTDDEEKLKLDLSLIQKEKEEMSITKLDLQKSLDSLEEKKKQVHYAEAKLETMTYETNELIVLEAKLKEEIDMIRTQKLELAAEAEQLKDEKLNFEIKYNSIDEKLEELRKEKESLAEEKMVINKFLKDERESLHSEKNAMREQYQRDLELLSRDREAFMGEVERERSEWFNKIQKEREDLLHDVEIQKNELENRVEKRREEIESYLKEKEEAFNEEKKNELMRIASLRETVEKEMEFVNSEMKRLEAERDQINLDHQKRNKEWAELNESIEELKMQRQKLENQRELLHADRKEILAQIEELRKLEDLKYIPDRITPQKLLPKSSGNSGQRVVTFNGTGQSLIGRKETATPPSPLSAPFSWLKRCADTLLEQKQNNKRRKQEKDVTEPSDILSASPLAKEASTAEINHSARPLNETPVGSRETTVYIDKVITTTEVTVFDIGAVAGNGKELMPQESDEKLENSNGVKANGNGKV
ncbi:OLC1v1011384C1 [Oldenlandia corymbosa var. corymbosa]|uniref:OLC1v1011384C1 n=1 Tax=Oldenlandia corymbosa var. corymbosa TaxID=529605 RepID=A0AAV1DWU3_OLDCO|nr:OLC1v1011384C1 [Oldenlandia corymbosa var. corymbosa]